MFHFSIFVFNQCEFVREDIGFVVPKLNIAIAFQISVFSYTCSKSIIET